MIKINLLKSKVAGGGANNPGGGPGGGGGGGDTFAPMSFPSSSSGASPELRETITKLFLMFIFVIAIMLYESQNIHSLQAEIAKQTVQSQELEQRAQAKDKEVEGIKDLENQARELEDKLKVLKLLSKLRLREVKTLDFVQSSVPEKVWLKTLNYEADKDKMEYGHFNFTGLAVSTEELTEFVKRLEDSAYLNEVIVMKNQEVSTTSGTKSVLRDFNFTAQVEVHK